MSEQSMTVEEARAKLGDLVIGAMSGGTTIITRYGKPAALVVPIEPDPLDERAMAMADRMEKAGDEEAAEAIRSALAFIREAWRGADARQDLADDFQTIAENAETAMRTILDYQDRPAE